jgi:NADPH-dependent glutamate synthase beta subunit-like oxidoreductase
MPQAVIPDYRLPSFIYREEIRNVISLGIEVRTEKRLGEDFSFRDLEEEGFSALYLALGAQRTVRLPHCGTEEEGFLDGIEFLRGAKSGEAESLHGHVLVIGGGNVAVDVAKTAVRLGGEKVTKVFLETKETMPAHQWECEEAVEEGVNLVPASATISFEKKDGRVASALCRRVERIEFDENRRIRPIFEEGSDFTLQADWVITAVGTGPDYSILPDAPKLKPLRKGARAGRFRHPEVPALPIVIGGDYFAGPASVIEAIAAGYEGALDIYRLLGKFSFFRLPRWNRIKPIRYPGYLDEEEKARRFAMTKVDPEVRCESFCEVCEAYDGKAAENEAARCLRCNWPMLPVTVRRRHPEAMPPVAEPPEPEAGRFV